MKASYPALFALLLYNGAGKARVVFLAANIHAVGRGRLAVGLKIVPAYAIRARAIDQGKFV